MSWIRDSNLTWCQRVAVNVVRSGPIPRHVAFIMDGNRRFANKVNLNSVTDGHVRGFDKLAEALQWCLDLGIDEVTVYAFSIENFKRQQNEVDTLMEMAREKFERLMEEKDRLNERGICIRMVGNWSLLPLDLQKCMANAMLLTKDNSRAILNVAFSYTSRDEMTDSVAAIVDGVQRNELRPGDISDNLIRRCMYTGQSSDPDLLVRTSGESRLSDFLLWQASASIIYFTSTLWPEFTIWHLIAGVFYYQRHHKTVTEVKTILEQYSLNDECNKYLPSDHIAINTNNNHTNGTTNITLVSQQISNENLTPSAMNDTPNAVDRRVETFLENFDKRKLEQLTALSSIKL